MKTISEWLLKVVVVLTGGLSVSVPAAASAALDKEPFHFRGLPRCSETVPSTAPCQTTFPMTSQVKSSTPKGLTFSAHGESLDVIYRGLAGPFTFGEAPYLGGDLQTFMEGGEDDLWSARIRIPNLDRAVLDISLANTPSPPRPATFQGEHADHAPVRFARVPAKTARKTLHSNALGADRDIYVFRGQRCIKSAKRCTLLVLADGEGLNVFLNNAPPTANRLLENLILIGVAAPPADEGGEMRIAELLLAAGQPEFQRFETFVLREVIPEVEGDAVPPKTRWVGGWSNGGAWAVDMALRHPETFNGALGFSIASFTNDWVAPKRPPVPGPAFLLGGGSLESPGFNRRTHAIATGLSTLGLRVEERQFTGGHSISTWNALFWSYLPEVVGKQTRAAAARPASSRPG